MRFFPLSFTRLSVISLCAALAACGGGGGDAGTAPSTTTVTGTDPIDKYAGTFVSTRCDSSNVQDANTNTPLFRKQTITFRSKSAANVGAFDIQSAYFDASTCTGTTRATSTYAASIALDGAATLSGQSADKLTLSAPALGGISAGTSVTINGIRYPGSYFITPMNSKEAFSLQGTDLFIGDTSGTLDAQGYPTTLRATAYFKKV